MSTSAVATLFQRPDRLNEKLFVITPIFNASRYRSRWRLYADFARRVEQAGAILYTIEIALGARDFVVTDADNPQHVQLRTWDMLWMKEASLNLIVRYLPPAWNKVAWIDADVRFSRDDWADETLHALEHYPLVQMWSYYQDLDSRHHPIGNPTRSFADFWVQHGEAPLVQAGPGAESRAGPGPRSGDKATYGHHGHYHNGTWKRGYPGAPGLAWAARREWWEAMGGLIDYQVLGAGDWWMAHAMTGQLDKIVPRGDTRNLVRLMREWQRRAQEGRWQHRPLIRNIGVVEGLALHYFHGPKALRRYQTREQILVRNGFDPDLDLKRDSQGLYALTDRVPQLRRDLQRYFSERSEDALG